MKKAPKVKRFKKRWIIILLFVFVIGVSYYKSYALYQFYSKFYVIYLLKYSIEDIIKIINEKVEIGDAKDLQIFVNRALRAYPNNYQIMKHASNALFKLGAVERGIALALLAYEHVDITTAELYNLIQLLYERENYSDIIAVMRNHAQLKDSRIAGMLGIALYFNGNYEEAISELEQSLPTNDIERLFFLAMSCIKTGKDLKAVTYLERAYMLDKTNKRIISELVALYGRIGQSGKASKLIDTLSWRSRGN